MRRYARSKRRKTVWERSDREEERGVGAPPPPWLPMPIVGTRKSTRVFVPKTSAPSMVEDDEPRVLRSGKRLVVKPAGKKVEAGACEDEWIRLYGNSEEVSESSDAQWWARGEDGLSGGSGWQKGTSRVSNALRATDELPGAVQEDDDLPQGQKFRLVYTRKRQRSMSDDTSSSSSQSTDRDAKDLRYGITYVRGKHVKKRKMSPLAEEAQRRDVAKSNLEVKLKIDSCSAEDILIGTQVERFHFAELHFAELALGFAGTVGIMESDLWNALGTRMVLVALVDSSVYGSLDRFSRLLVSVLTRMRKKGVKLLDFACLLLSKTLSGVFSQYGIHVLPVRSNRHASSKSMLPGAGMCRISGSVLLNPLVSLNFAALNSYFTNLHVIMLLRSRCRPVPPTRHLPGSCPVWPGDAGVEGYFFIPVELGGSGKEIVVPSSSTDRNEKVWKGKNKFIDKTSMVWEGRDFLDKDTGTSGMQSLNSQSPITMNGEATLDEWKPSDELSSREEATQSAEDIKPAAQNVASLGVKFPRNQKKRSSLRTSRRRSFNACRYNSSLFSRSSVLVNPAPKVSSALKVSPLKKTLEPIVVESIEAEDFSISPSSLSNEKLWKSSPKTTEDKLKEPKSTLVELKQNIDSVSCKANILVIESDRCWREEGAQVMLELTDSNEWCLGVKVGGSIRYMHKALEMRSSVTNRYTHAMIWTGENGWKLEFFDRLDWIKFKELHRECYDRNTDVSVKVIPVPGVRETSDYDDIHYTFARPAHYISTKYSELERALMSENAQYDMDSGDEEWLIRLNTSTIGEHGISTHVSEDNFENIIYTFEKAAYSNPDDALNSEKAITLCSKLADGDTVGAVFAYWLKKKKQKRSSLVRIFQERPTEKAPVTQRSSIRKSRSFKRQGSQSGRGKPAFYLQAGAKQEELRRVREAENAANKAEDLAIKLRSRAQILMANADLVTYKSVMALRLAEAIRESDSSEVFASILG